MKVFDLIKLSIRKYNKKMNKELLSTLCALYHEVFQRVDYDDKSIKHIYLRIISDVTVSMYFYVSASFDHTQHRIILNDIKFQMTAINFDFTIIPLFSNEDELETERIIKLK
jgi:hypothetical protein